MDLRIDVDRGRLAAAAIAVAAGAAVLAIAVLVFPYHSLNHDEAVYLQQAAMLLDGRLRLYAGDLAGALRPWFFVREGGVLYPKYAPVPAAMFALGLALVGEPRATLAAVAAGNAALVYLLAATLFDRRVGLVAAAVFAAAPMALVTSAVFLPYAPTTLLNLAFAVCYVRGVRDGRRRSGALAGAAIGLAFFARPYTAVLFAAPFVAHALWSIGRAVRDRGVRPLPEPATRHGLTAALGLAGVGVALAYNAALTGSPLLFPYEAFAPLDGPGFGRRRILGHAVEYTPALALRANGYALWYLATRWFTAGAIGTAFALAGAALATVRWRRGTLDGPGAGVPLLLGLAAAVIAGNVPFWGTHNALATLSDPTDGLAAALGPFYHFDLLVPLSIFAAVAVVAGATRLRTAARERIAGRRGRALLLAALAVSLPVAGVANAALVDAAIERNAAATAKYERAYAPFEERADELEDAVVFVPTPYGDWLNHPFQSLRNDPGFDGEVVYALDRGPPSDFAVIDAYPDRTYYRYAYRGTWTPNPRRHVTPTLERLSVRSGDRLVGETRVGVPPRVERAQVRLATPAGDHVGYAIEEPSDRIAVRWALDADAARIRAIDGERPAPASRESVSIAGADAVILTVTLVQPDGGTLTYRQAATVRAGDDRVEAVWPPERTVCPLVTDCGTEGTYLPDRPDAHRDGVVFETELRPA